MSNKIANGALRDAVLTLYNGILSCQHATQIHSPREEVTSRTPTTNARPFAVPIFTKHTNAQQHYVQVSGTEFHPNRSINVKNSDSKSFTS